MALRTRKSTTKLPKALEEELGIDLGNNGRSKSYKRSLSRKEQRKMIRMEAKSQRSYHAPRVLSILSSKVAGNIPGAQAKLDFKLSDRPSVEQTPTQKRQKLDGNGIKAEISKYSRPKQNQAPPLQVPQAMLNQLEQDDAEIAYLEKKLGIKDSSRLPKPFEDDGLSEILNVIGSYDRIAGVKRKRTDKLEELPIEAEENDETPNEHKSNDRRGTSQEKNFHKSLDEFNINDMTDEGENDLSSGLMDEKECKNDVKRGGDIEDDLEGNAEENELSVKISVGNGEVEFADDKSQAKEKTRKTSDSHIHFATRYIPPALRKATASDDEQLTRLQRQVQGLLNRLTESNILGIASEIEQLFRTSPRHSATSTVTDIVLGSVCDQAILLDTFMVLHAGLIAALYKLIGTDFGAHLVQRTIKSFDQHYTRSQEACNSMKECINLISFLSELYNLEVIGYMLIFDLIRTFVKDINELNTELLLKIARNSGYQLRKDDPTALNDLALMIRKSVNRIGENNLAVRTKFMIETITNLKNNKLKINVANSASLAMATSRIRKTLGTLNSRHLRATEPLGASLDDIRNVESKGKWWLVGASWRDNLLGQQATQITSKQDPTDPPPEAGDLNINTGVVVDIVQLAKEQRMNTDVRKAIFVAIMSSEDCNDACERLMRLRLKKNQDREIPKVLLHCAGAEESHNPYYALIARRLCAQHALKMTFQFCLWDLFKQMGEKDKAYDNSLFGNDDKDDEELTMRKIVNLAKLYGELVVDGALGLNMLKKLNLSCLQPKTRTFLEILFITAFLRICQSCNRAENAIKGMFTSVSNNQELVRGLLFFLRKYMRDTDIAGGAMEALAVERCVRVACKTMKNALAEAINK